MHLAVRWEDGKGGGEQREGGVKVNAMISWRNAQTWFFLLTFLIITVDDEGRTVKMKN